MSEQSTKDLILDVAEQLFSTQGFAATSLRAIIKEAGVNTASVHYHFGSREGLIEAVLDRRADPVNLNRIKKLDQLEADFQEGLLPVEGVVRAFLEPVEELVASGGAMLPRMMGYAIMEAATELRPVVERIFKGVIERFMPAFARALPGVSQEEVMWRVHFMLGAMVFTINVPRAQTRDDDVSFHCMPTRQSFDKLIEFVTAGMRAPVSEPTGKDSS